MLSALQRSHPLPAQNKAPSINFDCNSMDSGSFWSVCVEQVLVGRVFRLTAKICLFYSFHSFFKRQWPSMAIYDHDCLPSPNLQTFSYLFCSVLVECIQHSQCSLWLIVCLRVYVFEARWRTPCGSCHRRELWWWQEWSRFHGDNTPGILRNLKAIQAQSTIQAYRKYDSYLFWIHWVYTFLIFSPTQRSGIHDEFRRFPQGHFPERSRSSVFGHPNRWSQGASGKRQMWQHRRALKV